MHAYSTAAVIITFDGGIDAKLWRSAKKRLTPTGWTSRATHTGWNQTCVTFRCTDRSVWPLATEQWQGEVMATLALIRVAKRTP